MIQAGGAQKVAASYYSALVQMYSLASKVIRWFSGYMVPLSACPTPGSPLLVRDLLVGVDDEVRLRGGDAIGGGETPPVRDGGRV